ncbi:hypothetical protein H5410_056409 [Solanum commersonii]|uniref:Uncharacterized protein n=1 Tax=Solanum commersonii TaxID=4109 RepID=A0A9J5WK66_SOLCO|nr:hypothetical protein H5410_056409 [Solanum commersonii]
MDCNESYRNVKRTIPHTVTSNHFLVILQCSNWDRVKSYFKFENWCATNRGLQRKGEGVRSIRWSGEKQGNFTLNIVNKALYSSNNQIECWPWKVKIPYKVAGFTCVLAREVVLTHDSFRRKNISYALDATFVEKRQRQLFISFYIVIGLLKYSTMEDVSQPKSCKLEHA